MDRRCGWAIALAVSATLPSGTAQARDTIYSVSVPGGNLADALESLAAQTGISLAYEGKLPAGRVAEVRGRMRAQEALDRLLRETDLRAVRVGPSTFRLVPKRRAVTASNASGGASEPSEPPTEIIVTARKQSEALSTVAAPLSVYVPPEGDLAPRVRRARDVARQVDGLSVSNSGPGRDRLFIRGLADSPFAGFSQSTVSVQVDEGRVTYDAVEPGIALVDVARVEILKGPQGPLYGTGALGGVYRVVTNRPVIGAATGSAMIAGHSVAGGGIGANAEAVLNLPLLPDVAAIRLTGWAASDAGWIDNLPHPEDANETLTAGARAGLRVMPAPGWTVDMSGMFQRTHSDDSQYVLRDFENLAREARIREPRSSRFALAQGTVAGPVGALQLTTVISHAWQDQSDVLDASSAADALGVPRASAYIDRRAYRVLDLETRLASAPASRVAWTAGLSYVEATTRATGDVTTSGATVRDFFTLHRRVGESAVFVDASAPLLAQVRVAAGMRLFRTITDDDRLEDNDRQTNSRALIGFTPSASLAWEPERGRIFYARFATAFRPGGIDPANLRTGRYDADEVRNIDLGARLRFDRRRLSLDVSAFHSIWHHVQSDYLQPDGLVATRNAGDADITGAEVSLDWQPSGGWQVRAGLVGQRPRLVNAADGTDLPENRRLPVVPDVAARLDVTKTLALGAFRPAPYASVNYIGPTRLSFDDGLDRHMEGYALIRGGISLPVGPVILQLDIDNLLDTRADSFAYGNPFSIRSGPQFTPLRPRTVMLSLSRQF